MSAETESAKIQQALEAVERIKGVLTSGDPVSPMLAKTMIDRLSCPTADTLACPWFDQETGRCIHYKDRPLACHALAEGDSSCREWRRVNIPVATVQQLKNGESAVRPAAVFK